FNSFRESGSQRLWVFGSHLSGMSCVTYLRPVIFVTWTYKWVIGKVAMPKRRQTRSVSDIPIYDRCRDRSEERSWPWPQILCKHSTTDSGTIQLNDSFPVGETPLGGVMFIEVTSRMVGDALVVDISGELSRRASSLSNPMKELLAHDRPNLILNLSAL